MTNLTLCTYNCCSLRKNIDIIRNITSSEVDLLFLQESFITDNDLGMLEYVDENYKSIGVGATFSDKSIESCAGRPMGGLACLYRANSGFSVELVEKDLDFMIIGINVNKLRIIIVNCYIRSDLGTPDSLAAYTELLNKIESSLDDVEYDAIYMVGDFNADPMGGRAWTNLSEFSLLNNYTIYDVTNLPQESFTFIGNSSGNCKWLDHILGRTNSNNVSIDNIKVLEDHIGSDHLPLKFCIEFSVNSDNFDNSIGFGDKDPYMYVDWNRLTVSEIKEISEMACNILGNYKNNIEFICDRAGCCEPQCRESINILYDNIVNSVRVASSKFFKKKKEIK